jgi:hypothetical protein
MNQTSLPISLVRMMQAKEDDLYTFFNMKLFLINDVILLNNTRKIVMQKINAYIVLFK